MNVTARVNKPGADLKLKFKSLNQAQGRAVTGIITDIHQFWTSYSHKNRR
jgi:hypothetical protein